MHVVLASDHGMLYPRTIYVHHPCPWLLIVLLIVANEARLPYRLFAILGLLQCSEFYKVGLPNPIGLSNHESSGRVMNGLISS